MLPSSPVPSPCVNVCQLDEQQRWCLGCWRSLGEIAAWARLPEDDKRQVWLRLDARRAAGRVDDPVR